MTLDELMRHTEQVRANPGNPELAVALCDAVCDFYRFGDGYGTIYFAQIGEDGPIKIGFTAGNPLVRIAALQTGCPWPIRLLGGKVGIEADERALHRGLARHSISGEWFDPAPAVKLRVFEILNSESGNTVASFQKYQNQLRAAK